MRSILVLTLAAFLVPFAAADTYSGSVLVGHPVTAVIGGATENAEPCTTNALTNGVDGVWFDIQDDAGTTFLLTMDPTLDADVWFYDGACGFIDDATGAEMGLGASEDGAIPAGAAFAIVDGFAGTGSFVLETS